MDISRLQKSIIALLAVFTLGVALPAGAGFAQESGVAIKVNGETVKKAEIQSRIDHTVKRMKKQYGDKIKGKKAEERLEKQAKQRIVEQTVQHLVLKTHAEQSNVTVSSSSVEERVQKTIERFPSEEAFNKALKKEGMTKEQFKEQIREGLLVEEFLSQKLESTSVSDQEARSYYEQNSKRFQGRSFDEVKDTLKKTLQKMKQRQAQQELVSKLRKESDVEILI